MRVDRANGCRELTTLRLVMRHTRLNLTAVQLNLKVMVIALGGAWRRPCRANTDALMIAYADMSRTVPVCPTVRASPIQRKLVGPHPLMRIANVDAGR